jgi:hypothetical protein
MGWITSRQYGIGTISWIYNLSVKVKKSSLFNWTCRIKISLYSHIHISTLLNPTSEYKLPTSYNPLEINQSILSLPISYQMQPSHTNQILSTIHISASTSRNSYAACKVEKTIIYLPSSALLNRKSSPSTCKKVSLCILLGTVYCVPFPTSV